MNRRAASVASAAGIAAVVFALAFVAAPYSCERGLEVYFWGGIAALIALLVLPFATRIGSSFLICLAWGLGFVLLGGASWVAGLFAANVRIICRLF